MKNKTLFETIIGLGVLLLVTILVYYAYQKSNLKSQQNSYKLYASFNRIDGVNIGTEIMISGIKVGVVTNQNLNKENYLAELELAVNNDIKIPEDSSAEINSASLLGGKYIAIIPGGADDYLQAGDKFGFTQSSVNLEELLGKFAFSNDSGKDDDKEKKEDITF